jgi:hypothetical protein
LTTSALPRRTQWALARTHGTRAGKTLQHGEYKHHGKVVEAWIVDVDPYEIDEFFA